MYGVGVGSLGIGEWGKKEPCLHVPMRPLVVRCVPSIVQVKIYLVKEMQCNVKEGHERGKLGPFLTPPLASSL